MTKTKILALVLCISVMLMGAGYAYWSDSLNINNTVTTGEFNVVFTANAFAPYPYIMDGDNVNQDYIDSDITPNMVELLAAGGTTNDLTVTVNNMYPGAMALYAMRADNLGTIPAVFDYAEVILDGDGVDSALLRQNLVTVGGFIEFDKNNVPTGDAGWFGVKTDGTPVMLGELETYLNQTMEGLVMQPGDYIVFDMPDYAKPAVANLIEAYNPDEQNCFIYYLPTTANNDLQNQSEMFTIKLHFKQHNAPFTNP